MASDDDAGPENGVPSAAPVAAQQQQQQQDRGKDGPFVLRPVLEAVPLSADGAKDHKIKINCVDFCDSNLYVGTTASELLHFVQIPPNPADPSSSSPSYILASRLSPVYAALPDAVVRPGVQQILLLPQAAKACVLCNWTVTFYSLPELSPVFGTQVKNCNWIGGVDLNEQQQQQHEYPVPAGAGQTILLSLGKRIRAVRIGDDARVLKTTDYAGSILSVRREAIACVADPRGYSLLDIERQLKIPLMSISSLDESPPPGEMGHAQPIVASSSSYLADGVAGLTTRPSSILFQPHGRHTSLSSILRRQDPRPDGDAEESTFQVQSPPPPPASQTPAPAPGPPPRDDVIIAPGSATATPAPQPGRPPKPPPLLKPHIASPTPQEFLIVTGTRPEDPGIGMFVNLDGDPTRPTLQFERYPLAVAVEGGGGGGTETDPSSSLSLEEEEDGYVFASLAREAESGVRYGLEIQRWNSDVGAAPAKFWLSATPEAEDGDGKWCDSPYGIRSTAGVETTQFQGIVAKLRRKKFSPFPASSDLPSSVSIRSVDSRTALSLERVTRERELFDRDPDSMDEESPPLPEGWEAARNEEEHEFARRLAGATARLVVWAGDRIWWAMRNPLLMQLESALDRACPPSARAQPELIDRQAVFRVLASIRGRDGRTELEFMTYNYLRQRAATLLLANFLHSSAPTIAETKAFEEVVVESELDPRVVLALIPALRNEIVVGSRGMWVFGGVKSTAAAFINRDGRRFEPTSSEHDHPHHHPISTLKPEVLAFIHRFLTAWRRKKGFGSVDDRNVFRTVDAALLLVLLELDQPPAGSIRQDLYELVDGGVDCFERAVSLLEARHRLYTLSRLYQSRRMAADVLATWRRIIEGERDDGGGELQDGERRVREYLGQLGASAKQQQQQKPKQQQNQHSGLVRKYGVWLANRNPRLGVQVFASAAGAGAGATELDVGQVVALLREEAPDAVRYYLEHLVFKRGHHGYVGDLITHYLTVVIGDMEASPTSRDAYRLSYEAYRALRAPKPTFHHFLAANSPPPSDRSSEPWQSRLRLLQLLGGSHSYDAAAVLARVAAAPDQLLVPETVILAGREGRHEDALRLLVHELGDYDTAVAYCARGGSTIYGATVPRLRGPAAASPSARTPEQRDDSHASRRPLFRALLGEFLAVDDVGDRIEQAGALLERFGPWFDPVEVLALIPDEWPVAKSVGVFLAGALRRLVAEARETEMVRALRAAEHVRVSHDLVLNTEGGAVVVEGVGGPEGGDEGGREVPVGI